MRRSRRTTALVVGVLLLLSGLGLLVAGGSLGLARLAGGADGYLTQTYDPVRTASAAVVSFDVGVVVDAGVPSGLLDRLDLDVRLEALPLDGTGPLFVGIGPSDDVTRYLAGATHDRLSRVAGTRLVLEPVTGDTPTLPAPSSQSFWVASDSGLGATQLDWRPSAGSYSVVIVNADGSSGVRADVVAAGRAGFLGPLAVLLLVLGSLVTVTAALLLVGADRRRPHGPIGPGPGPDSGWPTAAHGPVRHRPSDRS